MCDTVVVVRPGQVLFAKNSDRDPNEAQRLEWVPARDHEAGARLRCTWIEIPQVRRTHAVVLSRPFWMWGAEMGANEHGVVLGNEAVFTREPVAEVGLTGMDLLRLALERAKCAEEAVSVITSLIEAHGQGGRCGHESASFRYHSSFLVADVRRAFVVETAGRAWQSEEVSGARSISNGLTIEGFCEAHSDVVKTWACDCRTRQPRTQALAAEARGASGMIRILRDHGEGREHPRYAWLNGAMDSACMHAGGLAAASQTTASLVAELSPEGVSLWATATAAPCTSLFKPVQVGSPVDLGAAPSDRAERAPLFWRHERLHRMVAKNPAALLPVFAPERDEVEARWLAAPPHPAEAFAEADRLLAKWTDLVAAVHAPDVRPAFVRRYWAVRERRAAV